MAARVLEVSADRTRPVKGEEGASAGSSRSGRAEGTARAVLSDRAEHLC